MITVHGSGTTLEELRQIPLETPKHTGRYWQGIQHGELVDTLLAGIRDRQWVVGDMRFSVSKNRADMVGAFDLVIPDIDSSDGTSLSLGISSDNNQQKSLRLYAGANITICTNGLTSGEVVLQHKHTLGLQLRQQIDWALDEYTIASRRLPGLIHKLRQTKLTTHQYEHLLLEAGRQGMMPWSRLADVDREYTTRRFVGCGEEQTSWALLNAFTWVVKRSPPIRQMNQINQFRGMLPTYQSA